jgi:hypothetical protein
MLCSLRIHPDFTCQAVTSIDVEATRMGAWLTLKYSVAGQIAALPIPAAAAPIRSDELWRRTCFEVFVGVEDAASYREFNFAPSRAWAAYRFDAYREGMRPADEQDQPRIDVSQCKDRLELSAAIDLAASLAANRSLRLGLSAVIEERNGNKSYWALRHSPGKPDFHHWDSWTLVLPTVFSQQPSTS